ncbi:hypothetical protein BC828DRAFT_375097 [Blastocladiella britannica]|nr:hypothetical protein BC828DRAFT_375097 [Blastocladiella britannica]
MDIKTFIFALHGTGIGLLLHVGTKVVPNLLRNTRLVAFWIMGIVALVCLLTAAATEIAFAAVFFNDPVQWTVACSLVGDIAARIGFLALALCRLYRYRLIVGPEQRKRTVNLVMAAVLLAVASSLIATIRLRLSSYLFLQDPSNSGAERDYLRDLRIEEPLALIVMLTIQCLNLAADAAFAHRLAVQRSTARQSYGPNMNKNGPLSFVPNLAMDGIMIISVIWVNITSHVELSATSIATPLSVTLVRFCPMAEAWLFFFVTVPKTRGLLRVRSASRQQGTESRPIGNTTTVPQSWTPSSVKDLSGSIEGVPVVLDSVIV